MEDVNIKFVLVKTESSSDEKCFDNPEYKNVLPVYR